MTSLAVKVIKEAGWDEAMLGLSLSHNQPIEHMPAVALKLSHKGGGHNKFLESMAVWLDVNAPRHWWQEADTYRVGITKQSSSTMHTLLSHPLTQADFDLPVPDSLLDLLNERIANTAPQYLHEVKNILPEGFMQRRIICTNYKTLQNMVWQRKNHRNPGWPVFCQSLLEQLEHPEYID